MKRQQNANRPLDILAVYALLENAHREHFAGVLRFFNERPNWRLHVKEPGSGFTERDVQGKNGIRYDGFIISLPGTDEAMRALTRSSTPTVLVNITDRRLAYRAKNLSTVWIDNSDIGRCGAEHLLRQGDFQSFGFLLAPDGQFYNKERESAFRLTLARAGHRSSQFTVPSGPNTIAAVAHWLDALPKPAAVMCAAPEATLVLYKACKHSGYSVPDQVAILSVNDNPAYIRETGHSISCVLPDSEEMGYRAAEELDRIFQSNGRHKFHEVVIPVSKVLARTSTKLSCLPSRIVQEATAFIRAHAESPIRVKDIVNHLGVSRRALETDFRKLLGTGIHSEIEEARISAVVERLRAGQSVTQTARELHYRSANALTRAFKRHFSQSIRDWQRVQTSQHPTTAIRHSPTTTSSSAVMKRPS